MNHVMSGEMFVPLERLWTRSTGVRPFVRVRQLVSVQMLLPLEACTANVADPPGTKSSPIAENTHKKLNSGTEK